MNRLRHAIESSLMDQGAVVDWDAEPPTLSFGGVRVDPARIEADLLEWMAGKR